MRVDIILKNGNVFNSYLKKFFKEDIAILDGKFLYSGKKYDDEFISNIEIDCEGKYIVPGLIDIHMHIESSMTTPDNFAEAVIKHGVTTLVADPHEIANVFGIDGIKAIIDANSGDTVDIFYGIPSSVPSTNSSLETTGGEINIKDVEKLLENPKVRCLGEVMNFEELISDDMDTKIKKIINMCKDKNKHLLIEGHCPKISGINLAKFIYFGVDADHTQQTPDSLMEKIKNGMFIEIQEKSMTQENIDFLIKNNLYEHFCFVTDDVMADKITEGHLNKLLKKAIKMGMSSEMAIYTSTYTPARRMHLNDRGSVAPGKIADFVILDNLNEFKIDSVYKNGKIIKSKENISTKKVFPENFYKSMNISTLKKIDFEMTIPLKNEKIKNVKCRVIEINHDSTFTKEIIENFKIKDASIKWENTGNSLIAVFDRHKKSGNKAFGFIKGALKKGAIASSYAHDHHNLMVMGKNIEDMQLAANWVIENQGGYCIVENGKVLAGLELPIAGILSEEDVETIGKKLKKIRHYMNECGYHHHNEIMSFSTLSLPVSPALKLTDKGLIDVKSQKIVSLISK